MIDLNKNRNDLIILESINALNETKKDLIDKETEINEKISDIQTKCKHLLILIEKDNIDKEYNGERCLICDKFSEYGLNTIDSIVANIKDFENTKDYSLRFKSNEHLKYYNLYYLRARKKVEEILNSDYSYSIEETKNAILNDLKEYDKELKGKKLLKRNDRNE